VRQTEQSGNNANPFRQKKPWSNVAAISEARMGGRKTYFHLVLCTFSPKDLLNIVKKANTVGHRQSIIRLKNVLPGIPDFGDTETGSLGLRFLSFHYFD
jgi:hypothetical protein